MALGSRSPPVDSVAEAPGRQQRLVPVAGGGATATGGEAAWGGSGLERRRPLWRRTESLCATWVLLVCGVALAASLVAGGEPPVPGVSTRWGLAAYCIAPFSCSLLT